MDILREVIFEQNNKLLKQISEDFYPDMEKEQTQFIYDYNKKNFTYMLKVTKDIKPFNEKRLRKISN
tara:strand:+ start:139 stop:339 length:201 start_codon:yes stop_codon:yes gene_type:complete